MKTATVITPTIGKPELKQAIVSVRDQTYPCKHIVVVDGFEAYFDKVLNLVGYIGSKECPTGGIWSIPENTGKNGFNGQRIYAAFPHLLDSDYILFLDEDNWYEPDHVETLIKTIEDNNLPFAYSLRSIYDKKGNYFCKDDCESLGKWPVYCSPLQEPHYMIDTSAYCFTKRFIQQTCHLWHSGPWGEDRRYLQYIKTMKPNFDTNGKYTLCYRLDGNPKSVTKEFFEKGNEMYTRIYEGKFPWQKI